ncbi:cell division protein DrpB [Enterobacter sp. Bisph1]|uniref:cell division protein DrpB n=1 Tax=Enterobacter sp. Bisph1 TaxID=1274399 RepID=UPI00057BEBDA|nr:cell division protein DrpB [Enterobacter sp. Bisph1]
MEDKVDRSLGGKLALWVFWIFCTYSVWSVLNDIWPVSQMSASIGFNPGVGKTITGSGLHTLFGMLVLAIVGSILGAIAWYTRPQAPEV